MQDESDLIPRSLSYKLANACRHLINQLNRNFKDNDLSITYEQFRIIIRLWKEDGLTQGQLASLTDKDEPSVSRLINNMIKRNLIERIPHPEDRRTNLIFLTEEGRNIQHELYVQLNKTTEEALRGISEHDVAICLEVLDKVIHNLT
ncbi:MarR family transcriptional regulator [Alicyclobacillus fastidiosus]|uniref:MarR family transcriptional regulator n=1 Tax=Alicyclobacillus fastidiosus TaxID=392011 RepID=A0ABY6ZEH0_9BACL|nr:MarR family transcriptional regulator [Alicyclobacillus fastidiosus]WAH40559.1 MarR family transcriptional regulator [Alicyclobacillus fastidiosus]GMA61993.1 MarR family transcriptional regulator [Alicyclobacillus fastidiosus]